MAERPPNKRQRSMSYRQDGTIDGDGHSNTTYVLSSTSIRFKYTPLLLAAHLLLHFTSFEHVTLHFGPVALPYSSYRHVSAECMKKTAFELHHGRRKARPSLSSSSSSSSPSILARFDTAFLLLQHHVSSSLITPSFPNNPLPPCPSDAPSALATL